MVLLIDIFYLEETLFFDRSYGNVNFFGDEMLKDMMKCCCVKRWSYMLCNIYHKQSFQELFRVYSEDIPVK